MRCVICACVVALAMGCGGGGGKSKHPDAATGGDGSGAADHAAEASGSGGGGGSDAAPGDPSSQAGSGGRADAGDVASSEDADAATDAGTDVNETGADLASETSSDAASDAVSDGDDAEAAPPRLVTVAFTGNVATVAQGPDAGMPLGFDSTVRLAPVSGSFTYDLRLLDDEPADPLRGKFQRAGTTAFSCTIQGHTVTGSGKAIVETENLNPDTFRFLDGPQGDTVVRTMKLDGADDPALTLSIAITDSSGAMLTSDALPDPFPTINIANSDGGFNISHTFSLMDGGGTLLMQLTTLVNQ